MLDGGDECTAETDFVMMPCFHVPEWRREENIIIIRGTGDLRLSRLSLAWCMYIRHQLCVLLRFS
jgi:hypothetical protein